MRRHLPVVSEKKIEMLKTTFAPAQSKVLQVVPQYFFANNLQYIHNKYMYTIRAYYLNTVAVMLRTDDARRRTSDNGCRTMDAGPRSSILYSLSARTWILGPRYQIGGKIVTVIF